MHIRISNNLQLRPFKLTDKESLTLHANNKNVWKFLTDLFPHPYHLSDAEKFINLVKDSDPPKTFAVEFEGNAIGSIGLAISEDNLDLCGDIGFWIGEEFWNRGIITASIKKMIVYLFNTFPEIGCISASVFVDNLASVKALEKSGLKRIKKIENAIIKAGVKKDIYFYRLKRDEYR